MDFKFKESFLQKIHITRFSTSLVIREMQIKIAVRNHLTLVKMAIIKKSANHKYSSRKNGTLLHSWLECKLVQPLWRTIWRFLKILKIRPPSYPAIPLLGINPQKTVIQKDTCTSVFTAALFTTVRTWKQPKYPPTEEWIKKR